MANKKMERKRVEITDMSSRGQGIGRVDQRVVFVDDAVVGDVVDVEVYRLKKSWMLGKVSQVVTRSSHYVPASCPYAGACGGCVFQHVDYAMQRSLKAGWIESALTRIGKLTGFLDIEVEGTPEGARAYRNRGRFFCRKGEEGAPGVFGMRAMGSDRLVDISACELMDPAINECLQALRREPALWAGDEVLLRVDDQGGAVLVDWGDSGGRLWYEHGAFEVDDSSDWLSYELLGMNFWVPARHFFQVNQSMAATMFSDIVKMVQPIGISTVWELYCGVGVVGCLIAPHVGHVLGVELTAESIDCARENVKRNGLPDGRLDYVAGDVEVFLRSVEEGAFHEEMTEWPEMVIVDPPRAGLARSVVDRLIHLSPQHILYISCDPATLARDLLLFTTSGYHVMSVRGYDMFGMAGHVETVVLMSGVDK